MTIRSAAALAVARDAPPRAEARAPGGPPPPPAAAPAAGEREPVGAALESSVGVLAAAVPTDIAAFYTTVLGVLAGILVENPGGSFYLPLRWWLYAGGLVATLLAVPIAYRAAAPAGRRRRKLPIVETVTAVIAFAVWGLVVPTSPLYFILKAPVLPIAVAILSAGGAMVLTAMLSPLLDKPAS